MKASIAVSTVSGKAYYLIVNELKRRNIQFVSLTPNEPVPIDTKVVITTKKEQYLIRHEKILVYRSEEELEALINEALQIVQGKEYYEKVVIGVDPGEVFGLAVLADGKVIETSNCSGVNETLNKIVDILKNLEKTSAATILVKIGDGVPAYREKLLYKLDSMLPSNIILESVSEAGTNRHQSDTKHRRGLRDIASAIRIAGRNGYRFPRRKTSESNS